MSQPDADHESEPVMATVVGEPLPPCGSPFAEYFCPPRLGIIHLLAWTAATAVLLSFATGLETIRRTTDGSLPRTMELLYQVHWVTYAVTVGAGLVGTFVVLRSGGGRRAGRLQPGHRLLLIETLTSLLVSLCWNALLLAALFDASGPSYEVWSLGYGLIELLGGGLYVYAAQASKSGKTWAVCFGTFATINMIQASLYGASGLLGPSLWTSLSSLPLWSIVVGIVLLVAVVLDLRRGRTRDWLHWTGVAMVASNVLMAVVWWVGILLFSRTI